VIKDSLMGKKVTKEEDDIVYIKVAAGEVRHDFVMWTLEQGYVGAENMVLIPSTVGAAPFGNIGAYGKEAKDIIHEVEGIDLTT
jgi:UDP-N-acetylmuramate dehydrogenase